MLKMVMGLGEVPQLEVDQACKKRDAGKRPNVLPRNASWPDNPKSAARRAVQDLVA